MSNSLIIGTSAVAGIEVVNQVPSDGSVVIEVVKIVTQIAVAVATLWKMLFSKKQN